MTPDDSILPSCPAPDTVCGTGDATVRPVQVIQATEDLANPALFDVAGPAAESRLARIRAESEYSLRTGEPFRGTHQSFSEAGMFREDLIVWLTAQGMTKRAIADRLGVSLAVIQSAATKPTFRQRVRDAIKETGKSQLAATLEAEVLPSIETLVAVRDDSDEKGSTRVLAANSILDRFLGKPVAKVETETRITDREATAEIDGLKQELAQVEAQLKAAGVQQPN